MNFSGRHESASSMPGSVRMRRPPAGGGSGGGVVVVNDGTTSTALARGMPRRGSAHGGRQQTSQEQPVRVLRRASMTGAAAAADVDCPSYLMPSVANTTGRTSCAAPLTQRQSGAQRVSALSETTRSELLGRRRVDKSAHDDANTPPPPTQSALGPALASAFLQSTLPEKGGEPRVRKTISILKEAPNDPSLKSRRSAGTGSKQTQLPKNEVEPRTVVVAASSSSSSSADDVTGTNLTPPDGDSTGAVVRSTRVVAERSRRVAVHPAAAAAFAAPRATRTGANGPTEPQSNRHRRRTSIGRCSNNVSLTGSSSQPGAQSVRVEKPSAHPVASTPEGDAIPVDAAAARAPLAQPVVSLESTTRATPAKQGKPRQAPQPSEKSAPRPASADGGGTTKHRTPSSPSTRRRRKLSTHSHVDAAAASEQEHSAAAVVSNDEPLPESRRGAKNGPSTTAALPASSVPPKRTKSLDSTQLRRASPGGNSTSIVQPQAELSPSTTRRRRRVSLSSTAGILDTALNSSNSNNNNGSSNNPAALQRSNSSRRRRNDSAVARNRTLSSIQNNSIMLSLSASSSSIQW